MGRALAIALLLAGLAAGGALAEDAPTPAELAADEVVAAAKANDAAALAALASRASPDPWLVVDALLARGERTAATAFANGVAPVDAAALVAFVAKQGADAAALDAAARKAAAAAAAAREAGQPDLALSLATGATARKDSIPEVRLALERAYALEALGKAEEVSASLVVAATAAQALGWTLAALRARGRAGNCEYGRAVYPTALEHWRAAVAIARARKDDASVAGLLCNVGLAERVLGHPDAAIAAHSEALVILERGTDRAGVATALRGLGDLYGEQGDVGRALAAYERAHAICVTLDDRSAEGRALTSVGRMLLQRGDYAKSKVALDRAIELTGGAGDEAGRAWALAALGRVHLAIGENVKALALAEEALGVFDRHEDRAGSVAALGAVGEIRESRGEYDQALKAQRRAFELARAIADPTAEGRVLTHEGVVQRALGDYRKSMMLLKRAAKLFEECGYRAGLAPVLGEIGDLERRIGRYSDALSTLDRAQRLFEEMGDRAGLADILIAKRSVFFALGDATRAMGLHRQGLARYEALGLRAKIATALADLGTIHVALEEHEQAAEALTKAAAIFVELGDRRNVARAWGSLADARVRSGKPADAIPLLERARPVFDETKDREGAVTALVTLGEAQRDLLRHDDALATFDRAAREAERLADPSLHVLALRGTAQTQLALGEAEAARAKRDAALGKPEAARAHEEAARGKAQAALQTARLALKTSESMTRNQADDQSGSVRSKLAELYDVGTLAAMAAEDAPGTAYFLENGRAGTLLESLGGWDALASARLPPDLMAEETKARADEAAALSAYHDSLDTEKVVVIRSAKAVLDGARGVLLDVAARTQRERKASAGMLAQTIATIEELQTVVRRNEALVVYGLAPKGSVALVVTSDEVRIVRLAAGPVIGEACEGLHPSDRSTDPTPAIDALRALVVDPLRLAAKTTRLLVSPDGPLSYAPFALLAGGRAVACVPSGTALVELGQQGDFRGNGVLALGDPEYRSRGATSARAPSRGADAVPAPAATERGGLDLPPLPATRDEAKAIGDVVLLGKDATEASLVAALKKKGSRWRAVHLACHGLVDAEKPLRCALALTPASPDDDGLVTAYEILGLSIEADLVVLSACETAKGKIVRGDGIAGLTRAIFCAGPPRAIVSLWKVDDAATRVLMTKFYERWKAGIPTAEALREAQEFVRKHEQWRHPSYWAAWVLWGLAD